MVQSPDAVPHGARAAAMRRALGAAALVLLLTAAPLLAGCLGLPSNARGGGASGLLADPLVRVALSHAFDANAARETVYNGLLRPVGGPAPATVAHGAKGPSPLPYNLTRAEALLDAAGYTRNAEGLRFNGAALRILTNAGSPERERLADLYAASLDRIGIRTAIDREPWPTFVERLFQVGDWDLAFLAWHPDYSDPDEYWAPLAASRDAALGPGPQGDVFNTGTRNPALDALLAEARAARDPARRAELYATALALHAENPNTLLVGQLQAPVILSTRVTGAALNPATAAPGSYAAMQKNGGTDPTTLVHAVAADPGTLDPLGAADPVAERIAQNVYQGLTGHAGRDGATPAPALATGWTVSDDGRTYTFHLKEGVTFHNGKTFTADDVVATFKRLLRAPGADAGSAWFLRQLLTENGIVAEGTHTVRFALRAPHAGFLAALASPAAGIIDAETCEANGGLPRLNADGRPESEGCGAWLRANTVGTGPYRVVEWTEGTRVLLSRVSGVAPATAPQRVLLSIVPDETARIAAMKRGEPDIVDVSAARVDALRGAPGIRLEVADTPTLVIGIFQTRPAAGG